MSRIVDDAFEWVQHQGTERLSFCVAFALFEFALKETFPVNGTGVAWPNWTEFQKASTDIEAYAEGRLRDAIDYVLNEPPMVQKARNGVAQFESEPLNGTGNAAVCEALRRIRNNLFHGGKQPYDDRDKKLVEAGLEIIEGYLYINPQVRDAFLLGAR